MWIIVFLLFFKIIGHAHFIHEMGYKYFFLSFFFQFFGGTVLCWCSEFSHHFYTDKHCFAKNFIGVTVVFMCKILWENKSLNLASSNSFNVPCRHNASSFFFDFDTLVHWSRLCMCVKVWNQSINYTPSFLGFPIIIIFTRTWYVL